MKEKLNPNCGIRLRECREAAGMTQKQLADEIHTTYQSISNIERGERRLTVDNARAAAKVLGVRMEYLLCEDNEKKYTLLKHRAMQNRIYSLLEMVEIILPYESGFGRIKKETEDEYIIGNDIDSDNAKFICCSYKDVDELSKMMKFLFEGWFYKKYHSQNERDDKLSNELSKYTVKHNDSLSYDAVLESLNRHIARKWGVEFENEI